ncbi:hypothetical protein BMW22_38850 (plasmid) [Rhizobium leguminosarum]|uniref:Uncharacterized protein n=1 Tax=Rhizobium leguminosarum TaxID=384 RepID=A0A1L3ZNZ1_RHILE|nr:hypothetical protein BMW22_38850 [Rhizobium leguminosarum]
MELWIIEWPVGKEEQKKNEADPWEIEKTNSPQAQLTEADPSKWAASQPIARQGRRAARFSPVPALARWLGYTRGEYGTEGLAEALLGVRRVAMSALWDWKAQN